MSKINTQTLAEILSKPSRNRMDYEIRSVCAWLREKVKYFKKLSDEILQTLVIECTAEKIMPNKVVIWEGEIGDCMYILLSGKLNVHRLTEPDSEALASDEPMDLFSDKVRSQPSIQDHAILGQCLASLESGKIFGEVALIAKCMRTASVVTTEECQIVVIPRNLYNNTVAPVLEEEYKMKLELIESVSFFSCCSHKHKKQLLMAIESYSCDYPTQIMKQGEPVSAMYFLVSGEVRISCLPQHHHNHFEKAVKEWNLESENKTIESFLNQKYQKQKNQFNLMKSKDICLLSQTNQDLGDKPCIGDIELLLNLPISIFTATATSRCVIFVLQMRHFERIILKRNPASILMMLELSQNRLEHWSDRLSIAIPLLSILKDRITHVLRNLQGYKSPTTFTDLLNKNEENIYQYYPPTRGAIINLYGPGTTFYYIKNQYHLREQNRKHNQTRRIRKSATSNYERRLPQKVNHLQMPNDKNQNRTEIFSKDADYGVYYDNHTKELEGRIENFLKILNSDKPTVVEPLCDTLDKVPKMKFPRRGNLVILKPVSKPQKYLKDSNLSTKESIRLFIDEKRKD